MLNKKIVFVGKEKKKKEKLFVIIFASLIVIVLMEGINLWVLNKKSFGGQGGGNKRMMFFKNLTRSRRGEEINNKEAQVDNTKFVAHT